MIHDHRGMTRCGLCRTDNREQLVQQLARDMFESRCNSTHDYRWEECSGYRAIFRGFAGVVADSIDADRHGRCLLCTSNDRNELILLVARALWDSRQQEGDLPWERADQWQVKFGELAAAAFASLRDGRSSPDPTSKRMRRAAGRC